MRKGGWTVELKRDWPVIRANMPLLLFFGIVGVGAFDIYTGDIASRGLRYQLLRAEPGMPRTALGTVVHSDQIDAAGILPFVGPYGSGVQPGLSWGWGVTFLDANLDGWQDLAVTNGEDSWTLPMPARIVADSGGIVRATDIDPNYTSRPEPDKTLDDVRAIV